MVEADGVGSPSVAGEDRYRKLIHHTPVALLHVDVRPADEVFVRLRAEGISAIGPYLETHPELVEAAKDGVVVTEVNRAAVALFRARDAAELIAPVRYLFTTAPDMANRIMTAHFEGRRNYVEQAKVAAFDGTVLDVVVSVTFPVTPEALDTTFITLEDVTERLRIERELRRLQADFAHAARVSTLGELAASIAHEVKQPLAAIVTNAETSLRWLGKEDPDLAKVAQLTTRIAAGARRANEIIQRIQAMTMKHEPESVRLDLNAVVEEALQVVRHDLEAKDISLCVALAPGLPAICGDRVQLQQVVVNLVVNSVQAMTSADGGERRVDIVTAADGAGAVQLSVRDTGPGVPDEDLARVFEGFFTTKATGVGIGLAICQSIIGGHGGVVSAANHPRGGAIFRVTLPAEA